jgi:hypothetical protein
MKNLFEGKAIKLLKPYVNYNPLILDPANGELKTGEGTKLVFGEDYLLVEDTCDKSLIRVFDSHNTMVHEFYFEI